MEIIEIYPDHLYSVKYDDCDTDEYNLLFEEWSDKDYLLQFFNENAAFLDNDIWGRLKNQPELAAASVIEDAYELESKINKLCENSRSGENPDLETLFRPLDGKYIFVWDMIPVKGYGCKRPSFIRLYAIKMDVNVYLITCGGLKLESKIQNSPGIKDTVFVKIDKTIEFLKNMGITDTDDIKNELL